MNGFFSSSTIQREKPIGLIVEAWVPVKGFEGFYEVSNLGRVRSLDRVITYKDGRVCRKKGKLIKSAPNKKRGGYFYVGFTNKTTVKMYRLHRLVAEHFIPNPENKPEVNHEDGDKSNCRVDNLKWATPKENGEHAAKTGLLTHRKLSPNEVIEIRRRLSEGEGKATLAQEFGTALENIYFIFHRKTWRWL